MIYSRILWNPTKSRTSRTQKYLFFNIVDHDKSKIDERPALILSGQYNRRPKLISLILKTRRNSRLTSPLDEHRENPKEPHKLQEETSKDILIDRIKLIKIIRSSIRIINRKNNPMGQLPMWFYTWSDADGNGR